MDTRTSVAPPHLEYFPSPPPEGSPAWRWWATIADDVRQLARFWPVIQNMVAQDLRVKYQRSMLGFLWTLLNPILMMLTLTLVFAQLFKVPQKDYAIYLFAGMVPWGLLAASINDCEFCILNNEPLIRKIYLPKLVFPLSKVLLNLTMFLLSLGALFLLVVPLGARFTPSLLLLPVAVLLFTMFATGLGLIVATMNTFFRDFGHLVAVFLQAWYFATPVMYDPKLLLPADVQWRFWLNPAYPFIRMFQIIIREGACPDGALFLVAAGIATVSLGIGYAAFKSHEDKLVFRL